MLQFQEMFKQKLKDCKLYLAKNYLAVISRVFLTIVVLVSLVLLSLIAPPVPPPNPEAVAREVRRLGHDTTDIYFTFVEHADEFQVARWIFKSSQPIYHDGQYIQQWMVRRVQLMPVSVIARHSISVTPIVG